MSGCAFHSLLRPERPRFPIHVSLCPVAQISDFNNFFSFSDFRNFYFSRQSFDTLPLIYLGLRTFIFIFHIFQVLIARLTLPAPPLTGRRGARAMFSFVRNSLENEAIDARFSAFDSWASLVYPRKKSLLYLNYCFPKNTFYPIISKKMTLRSSAFGVR